MNSNLVQEFQECSIKHFNYSKEGDWKNANKQIQKIDSIYKNIIQSEDTKNVFLDGLNSEHPEVSLMTAVYGMTINTEKCLQKLNELGNIAIPLISFSAKRAVENWKNKQWDIG